MIALSPTTRIFVYTDATDMRKGFCGLSGLVKEHFQVDLFSGHLPLYRGEDIFARAGLMIPRNTQFGMLLNVVALIAPLVEMMKSRVVSGRVIGVDDTSVRLQDASLAGKMRTARFWLYRGQQDNPYNVFDFTKDRGRDGPAKFLKDFRGHTTVDAYGVHEGIYLGKEDQIFAACCNAHARRKFVEAKPNDRVAAARALSMYRKRPAGSCWSLGVFFFFALSLFDAAAGLGVASFLAPICVLLATELTYFVRV